MNWEVKDALDTRTASHQIWTALDIPHGLIFPRSVLFVLHKPYNWQSLFSFRIEILEQTIRIQRFLEIVNSIVFLGISSPEAAFCRSEELRVQN